jgi:glycine cleavage system transcriptional repressor
MRTDIVFTLTGMDRVGIVEEVTGVLLRLEGNVETSRMVRLGGEFALLMLVSLPSERLAELDAAVSALFAEGYRVTTSATQPAEEDHGGWLPYQVIVTGADHEGIIHEIALGLSQRGINIESMDTGTAEAPVSGTPLFSMKALVMVPPDLAEDDWMAALAEAGDQANVDIEVIAQT